MALRQVIPCVKTNINYGGSSGFVSLLGGQSVFSLNTFSESQCAVPCPVAGIFSKLYAKATPGSNGLTTSEVTVTLRVNGANTALTVTIPAGGTLTLDLTHSVSVSVYDSLTWGIAGTVQSAFGFDIQLSVQFEPTGSNNLSIYGISAAGGSITANSGKFGGAFNNGVAQSYIPATSTISNTYSLSALNGNITKLVAKRTDLSPTGGSWVGYVRVNGVIQDGSGGTVDTRVTILDSDVSDFKTSTFTLPISIQDKVDLAYVRLGTTAPNPIPTEFINGLSMGIAFDADDDYHYMLSGGDNNALSNSGTNYIWVGSYQLVTTEVSSYTPIGGAGLLALAFYGESGVPGSGKSFIWTLRKSGSDTDLSFTIADFGTSGSDTGSIQFLPTDFINLQYQAVNTPATSQFHWGIAFSSQIPTGSRSGIYKLVPGKTNDTIYTQFDPNVTEDVAIPNPFIITALLGEEE